jgi:lactate racemase
MEQAFAFGKGELILALPEGPQYQVIKAQSAQVLADPQRAIEAALDDPVGCAPLAALAAGRKTATIVVCDITRPAPNAVTLPPLLERLHRAGIAPEGVTILIATGLHRAATPEELSIILGPAIASRYRTVSHDARHLAAHRFLGSTQRGTPVYIDEHLMAADLHITLGLIEPHLMLGFSGGRKLVAPGVAAQETIKVIHSPKFMREEMATEGSIRENPLHQELLAIARMARQDFILDVTLTPSREISGVFAGEPVQAHAAGVDFLCRSSAVHLEEPVDAVVTSAAGYPLDLTFYQTIKGITAAQHILRPGGKILIVAECGEGVGSPEFAGKLSRYRGAQEFLDEIQGAPVEIDQWQLEKLALVERKHEVFFYAPGVTRQACGVLGLRCFSSAHSAVEAFFLCLPQRARVALIPDGPYAYVRLADYASPALTQLQV